ncbi:MAG TPA: trehalase family glycosidase [Candidatus Saccharimonadales bacterium]|nr:trehalase family glycosidase [Candidatus Saccharimonadales bacterium]
MLDKAKKISGSAGLRLPFIKQSRDLRSQDVQVARDYIRAYWPHLERYNPKDTGSLIGVPKPYLVPSYAEGHEFDYNELYYWDSYFMIQGLLDAEHKDLVMGILEDLIYIFRRFHIIPNGSQLYYVSRTQPPFLTSFIFDVYNAYNPGDKWLKEMINVAKEEYETVWMGTAKPNARQVYRGLSRYYDFNYLHDIAEAESGWDMTPRFGRKCMNYLPVDLNALLYKYETDFARTARMFNEPREAALWERAAEHRKHTMNALMWDEGRGLFYDYNYVKERRGNISSLAAYYPMWAGLVNDKQAKALVKALKRFEQKGGLATTDNLPLGQLVPGSMPTQWAYPNGWAPLQFIVIKGLERYGYHEDAKRLATKWLRCNLEWFNTHKEFLEKYNVVAPDRPPAKGVYPSQTGFGWTNAVFERLCQEYIDGRKSDLAN